MMGRSFQIKRRLCTKSVLTVRHMLPSERWGSNGIARKSSMTAERKKQTMQIIRTAFSPYALYKMPPSTGPVKAAKELMVLIIEFAAIRWSGFTSAGMLACTDGWYALAMPYNSISAAVKGRMGFPVCISREKARMTAAVKKSSATMMFRLLIRSATMPPIGDSRIAGRNAHAVTVP